MFIISELRGFLDVLHSTFDLKGWFLSIYFLISYLGMDSI